MKVKVCVFFAILYIYNTFRIFSKYTSFSDNCVLFEPFTHILSRTTNIPSLLSSDNLTASTMRGSSWWITQSLSAATSASTTTCCRRNPCGKTSTSTATPRPNTASIRRPPTPVPSGRPVRSARCIPPASPSRAAKARYAAPSR